MVDPNFRLGLFEARVVVPVQELSAGTHKFQFGQPAGNSLLSTIFVRAIDPGASVKVNYYDFGPGDGSEPGERIDLAGHPLVSAGDEPVSDRRVIARISNKPVLEIIVAGGSAEVGVHIAVVADFPSEADPTSFFKTYPGVASFASPFVGVTTPGVEQTLYSASVPSGTIRHLASINIACRMEGRFSVTAGGTMVGSGRTGAAVPNARFVWSPQRPIAAGDLVEVKFTARLGSAVSDLEAYLQMSDETV